MKEIGKEGAMTPAVKIVRILPDDGAGRDRAFRLMFKHVDGGGRIIIGTDLHCEVGSAMARFNGELLVVKRRATREEFIENAPAPPSNHIHPPSPFYWELEVKKQ